MTRNEQIVELRRQGLTYKAIAQRFGLSACRIPQILGAQTARQRRMEREALEELHYWEHEWRIWLPLFQQLGQKHDT